ncbi:transporter [Mucilaginibacter gotjawali]|uniref:Uncharacterized protein n=1 Tax=Mucilaginibacter gotjawali TaxID=1550579 RepID=A0A839SBP7_9SPHI|nr:transporter [Mucilaginibacter gotjawali]MBB3054099.1 hypothetical protein [Mucilaginibacter gotjawali]
MFLLTSLGQITQAQTDADALMIPKNMFCAVASFDHSSWTNYWEGTFKRNNLNIGTLSANSYMAMGNYGITNKLDLLFTVPYVTTNATSGTLKGQSGFQDLTLTLKYLAFQTEIGKGIFSVHAILSGTLPLSNYEPNFLPVSIGLHSQTASLRGLVNYQTGRFFVAGAAQYVQRSDITIDQNAYYTTQMIYSNRVYMPNVNNLLFSAGYRSLKLNIEGIVSQTTTLGGFDIRKNDMPFPSNRMNFTTAGGLVKYSFDGVTGLELTAGGNYVLKGRNVGQSTDFFGAVQYVFDFNKKHAK